MQGWPSWSRKMTDTEAIDCGAGQGFTLFITYDGLTDPLGASQILPYIRSIAGHPRQVHVLSFEKPERYEQAGAPLARQLAAEDIGWTPLEFHRGGKLAKLWDLARMHVTALQLVKRHKIHIVHCRSYQAAQVGCLLKRLFGIRVLFDMRGLWVDERIDGGLWSKDRLVDRLAYRYYKHVERRLVECADHIVALTERVVPELHHLAPDIKAGVTVIPCCADFSHFEVLDGADRSRIRFELGIPEGAPVLLYLGSLGTWYCLDEMLDAFIAAVQSYPDMHMLLVTRDWNSEYRKRFEDRGGKAIVDRLHVRAASRDEVPGLIGACDVMVSFIKPAYSKIASSPTKLAEAFACGVPAICNPGIGDVDAQLEHLQAGCLIELAAATDPQTVRECLEQVLPSRGAALRERARQKLDLLCAESSYRSVYAELDRP